MSCIPMMVSGAAGDASYYERFVDANTMDSWKNYFNTTNVTTENAGGVWTDKSVFTDASAFQGTNITMQDSGKNFLTALSAIAANKEIVGYSTVPTDTVLVLDLSNSMPTASRSQLVDAANNAIKDLMSTNKNNRVGVVLYSGSNGGGSYSGAVTRLLPLDSYTSSRSDGNFIRYSNGTISIYTNNVTGTKNNNYGSKQFGGATYIQGGLWEAYEMFKEVGDNNDIQIGADNWQSGEYRMPILVLMSDGGPTMGATQFDNVKNQGNSNVGDGNSSNMQVGQGFLVQLTASYIKNRIENIYKVKDTNGAGRSLFYSLAFNMSGVTDRNAREIATNVLNPDSSTLTDALWNTYKNASGNTMQIYVEGTNGRGRNVTITKNSYATSKSYVDRCFSASGTGLSDAFDDIVKEIILQSRYYPTHLEGGSPDFSGYIEFTDTLGEYMEVKNINGLLLGNTLFDGHMMASKLSDTSSSGLGTPEAPTELGSEYIRSIKQRLGISSTDDAHKLFAAAWQAGQLKYVSNTDYSNYIGWYAREDQSYISHWDESATSVVPADAAYKVKSYAFLGKASTGLVSSDMMYMTVRVLTNIKTGKQTVSWYVPASLVPMVTYKVELNGINIDTATNIRTSVENPDVSPIRLVYETGLRSDLNEFNITRVMGDSITSASKTDARHIDSNGVTRLFWNNAFDISGNDHTKHKVAISEFTPNLKNERFYYTFDSAVFKKVGNSYELVGKNEFDSNATYYHRRYIFTANAREFLFEELSAASKSVVEWKDDFQMIDGEMTGAWYVPENTPARELEMYSQDKGHNSPTESAHMVFYPYLSEQNNLHYVDTNLGNNGLLKVTPATGIKISKEIDVFEQGTADTFKFRITINGGGSYDSWIMPAGATPSGTPIAATFTNGTYEFTMKNGETFWITGLSSQTQYTVEELPYNEDYKLKSVSVNGVAANKIAQGTVAEYSIDDVRFVNTAIGEGDLVITKEVLDTSGNRVDIDGNIKFTAEVTLTTAKGTALSGQFQTSKGNMTIGADGKFTVTLAEGESFVIRGLDEGTQYTVSEPTSSIPDGFALDINRSNLSGVVDASENDQALIVNTYSPVGTSGNGISVEVVKNITGRDWLIGESYTFTLERMDGNNGTLIGTATISSTTADKKHLFSLANEDYSTAGTYYYRVLEQEGNQGGIDYDTAERSFSVVVADSDMDGDLEIVAVNNELRTTVTDRWKVNTNFNNIYSPSGTATAEINIKKLLSGHSLAGYQFALYDEDGEIITKSGLTDSYGNAKITLNYAANVIGNTFTYTLKEINAGQTINNILYDDISYTVSVEIKDNKQDGSVYADVTIIKDGDATNTNVATPSFQNTYVPSSSDYVTIVGEKVLDSFRTLNAGEFSFKLEAITQGAPMPGTTIVTNDANGFFAFPAIEFSDSIKSNPEYPTFRYKVTEIADSRSYFDFDSTEYIVTVTITENGTTLIANESISSGATQKENIVFTNRYNPTPARVTFSGTKLLTGKKLNNGEFSFFLRGISQNATLPNQSSVVNGLDGSFSFGSVDYYVPGTYIYEITEDNGGNKNITYDASVYRVTVVVTDNSEGMLSAAVTYQKNGAPSLEVVFKNSYLPDPINYNINLNFDVYKELVGRDNKPLSEGEFEFRLINAINGQQIGETIKNKANGEIIFPTLTFAEEGTYHYKLQEVVGNKGGITYEDTVYHLVIGVKKDDNGILGIIREELHTADVVKQEVGGVLTEVTKYNDVTAGGKIVFTNTYKPAPVNVTLSATKTLSGRDLIDREFKFDLHKVDASTLAHDETTLLEDDVELVLQADGTGLVTFDELVFEEVGTHYYCVLEDELDQNGVITDKTEYIVKVEITDDYNGNLVATVTVDDQEVTGDIADSIVFRNVYKIAAGEIIISGTKKLENADIKDYTFTFELFLGSGAKQQAVTNDELGNFKFNAIPVDSEGEYVFIVREVIEDAEGITYDESEYTVKVIAEDNGDGTYKLTYSYFDDGNEQESIIFVNTYTEPTPDPTPDNDSPLTGNKSNLGLWIALLFVSGIGMFATVFFTEKQKRRS